VILIMAHRWHLLVGQLVGAYAHYPERGGLKPCITLTRTAFMVFMFPDNNDPVSRLYQ